MPPGLDESTEHLLREFAPQVLSALLHQFREFASCEDAVQDALLAAALQWPQGSVPENPRAWLIQVAARRMTDHVRSETARRRREAESDLLTGSDSAITAPEEDDTLTLLFMCCHPSLTTSSAIALTLRAVGGLTTAEIARAFLIPEATMAQRISRAKSTIRVSGVRFEAPGPSERTQRLTAVLHAIYLIFSEGYTSSGGPDLQRLDLSEEAIRLMRLTYKLRPDSGEAAGLLALMLLTHARRYARSGPHGELIPLQKQDRTRWVQSEISEGIALLTQALSGGTIGPWQLQAAIAALHDEAARYEDTDWPQILALYELLRKTGDNPMVMLNHAIAVAMVHGPSRGLRLLESLNDHPSLVGHHRLPAVRAHLLEMTGDPAAAATHYRVAASRTLSLPERNYLLAQAARLETGP